MKKYMIIALISMFCCQTTTDNRLHVYFLPGDTIEYSISGYFWNMLHYTYNFSDTLFIIIDNVSDLNSRLLFHWEKSRVYIQQHLDTIICDTTYNIKGYDFLLLLDSIVMHNFYFNNIIQDSLVGFGPNDQIPLLLEDVLLLNPVDTNVLIDSINYNATYYSSSPGIYLKNSRVLFSYSSFILGSHYGGSIQIQLLTWKHKA